MLMIASTLTTTIGVLFICPLTIRRFCTVCKRAPISARVALRDLARYPGGRSGTALAAISLALVVAVAIIVGSASARSRADRQPLRSAGPCPDGQTGRDRRSHIGPRAAWPRDATRGARQHASPGSPAWERRSDPRSGLGSSFTPIDDGPSPAGRLCPSSSQGLRLPLLRPPRCSCDHVAAAARWPANRALQRSPGLGRASPSSAGGARRWSRTVVSPASWWSRGAGSGSGVAG